MTENESNRGWQWLLPVSLVADVSAVLTVMSGSASTATLVIGVVALLIGVGLVLAKIGKPVDKVVLLAVVGIVAGTAAVSVVTTRAFTPIRGQASDTSTSSSDATTGSSTTPTTTTTTTPQPPSSAPQEEPGVKRKSGDKPIQLTDSYGVDLDSAELDWGATRTSSSDISRLDLSYDGFNLSAPGDLATVRTDATLEDCIRAGYKRYVSRTSLGPEGTFCVKTNGKSFARVQLTKKSTNELLVLDVLVWAPAT